MSTNISNHQVNCLIEEFKRKDSENELIDVIFSKENIIKIYGREREHIDPLFVRTCRFHIFSNLIKKGEKTHFDTGLLDKLNVKGLGLYFDKASKVPKLANWLLDNDLFELFDILESERFSCSEEFRRLDDEDFIEMGFTKEEQNKILSKLKNM